MCHVPIPATGAEGTPPRAAVVGKKKNLPGGSLPWVWPGPGGFSERGANPHGPTAPLASGPKPLARGSKREAILGPSSGPRPGRLTGGQVWGVGGYTPPGTTQAVPAVQLVWGVPPTTNGSSLGDFPRNSPGAVSPYFKKGWGWPGGPGDSGGGLGPRRGRFHIGKLDFSARAYPPERTAPRPKKLHVCTRTTQKPA